MKKKLVLCIFASLFLTACGSADKKITEVAVEKNPNPERVFKVDYDLVDASEKALPDWLLEPSKVEKSSEDRKMFRYFINESANTNQRLCEKSAEARATGHIGAEIAQFIKNSFAEATQGGATEGASEYMQEQLAQEAQSFLAGVTIVKKYWEKRNYKEALGATENMTKYYCYVVVKMNKKDVEKAVERSKAKILGQIQAPEVKTKTDKALADVAKKFTDLEAPVKVQGEP
jgi:hypothetical protein